MTDITEDTTFDHIPSFPSYLCDLREHALKTVVDPEHLGSVRCALDVAFGTLLAEFKAPIPSCRWVVLEYSGDYDSVKQDIVEHTRPAMFKVQDYWDQVNG